MALAAAVSILIKNLLTILDDKELNSPRLKKEVSSAKAKLEHVRTLLTEAEAKQNTKQTVSVDKLETRLLKRVYSSDDMIESFCIRTELQRRKFLCKVRPFTQLLLLQSQSLTRNMKEFVREIDVACTECEDQREGTLENKFATQSSFSKVDGGDQDTTKSSITKEEAEQIASNEDHVHPDGESSPNEQPAKAYQADIQPASRVEPSSAEVRRSVSDQKLARSPEPNSQQTAAELSSQQPAADPSSQQPAAKPTGAEAEATISDEKDNVQYVKPNIPSEPGAEINETTISEEKRPQQLPLIPGLDDDSDFIGRKVQADELTEVIRNHHKLRFLISVVGAAGSGKTTFLRNIYNKADIVQNFQLRAWVNVSEEFPETVIPDDVEHKKKNLLIDILRQVAAIKEEEKLPLDKLEEKVRDFFIRKRFLIVLDDVKTSVMWESVKRTFPNSLNGSRMILITRDDKIAAEMNDQGFPPVKLLNLDIDESWALFLKKVGQKEEGITDESLKQLIFDKCKGLPLAIVVLGGLLSTKDPGSWSKMVDRLSFGDDPSKAILALAYQDLASELKPCLLYLGLFPKDHEISVRRLFRLWAAEGFATPTKEGETPEFLVEKYLQDLIQRNMIDVSKWRSDESPKRCRVPGILYDNVFPSAAEIGFFHVLRSLNYDQQCNIRRVAAYLDISNPVLDRWVYNLRSYISFNTRKGDTPADEIDRFINKIIVKRGFGLLTVLDLENVYKPVLTETIGKLIHLRKKSLGEDWFNRLKRLTKLGLTCHFESLGQVTNWISKSTQLRALKLRSIDEFSRPADLELGTMNQHKLLSELYLLGKLSQAIDDYLLPQSLRMLTLSVSQLKNDPMQYLGQLPHLKVLRLFARSYLGSEMTCHAKGFPELRVLKLWMLEKLEKWTVEEGSMPLLKELEIRRCEALKETSGLQNLTTLKELTLTNMPNDFVAKIESSMEGISGRKVAVTVNKFHFAPVPK
ncbi:Disease resistance protein RPP13, putative [Ricinus communis]|uniref:Disease resistance protein RPP13, putative n=1 Tax=Ricinus communis TaxID=3988 RepID=B9R7D8_RICCO|nr:Disease resistance protein RPP13, putative [Ricinus communis]